VGARGWRLWISDSYALAVSMSIDGVVFPEQSFMGSLGCRMLLERVLEKSAIDVLEEG
jgi:hypothetical protein